MIGILFSIFMVLIAGSAIKFSDKYPLPLKLALFYGAGTVVISLYMFLLSLFGINYTVFIISLPFLIYFGFRLPDILKYIKSFNPSLPELDPIFLAAFILLAATALSLILNNIYLPVFRADAIGGWVFRAKVFFFEKRIPYELFRDTVFINTADYPVLIPLNLAWGSLCAGAWSEAAARMFFSLQFISALVIFYYMLKDRIGSRFAVYAALIAFTLPTMLTNIEAAYVDFSLAFYVMVAALFFVEWLGSKKESSIYISAFFMGAACFTKNDGIGILLAMLAVILIDRKPLAALKYAAISAAVFIPYKLATVYFGIKSHMVPASIPLSNLARIPALLGYLGTELFNNAYAWLYFWIILFIILILNRHKLKNNETALTSLFLGLSILVYLLIYLIVPDKVFVFAQETMNRLLLGLAPVFCFMVFSAVFKKDKNGSW